MITQKTLILWCYFLFAFQSLCAAPLVEHFTQMGYFEICDKNHEPEEFDSLYAHFDELIEFLQINPIWAQRLYAAKERFIRSNDRHYYSTNFFGFYDESKKQGRNQVSFYYSTHFHEFLFSHYPEFKKIPAILRFFETCFEIQKPCYDLFIEVSSELGLDTIFDSKYALPPILFKVIKYLPSYVPAKPHYDGSAFSLFLNSTDNLSLLLSPYKSSFTIDDFSSLLKTNQNSIVLIPGSLLTEFSIFPTPHIVTQSGKTRYASIAFSMRPNYIPQKFEFSPLPNFNH